MSTLKQIFRSCLRQLLKGQSDIVILFFRYLIVIDRVGIGRIFRHTVNTVGDDIGVHLIVKIQVVSLIGKDLLDFDVVRFGCFTIRNGEFDGFID